MNPKISIIVPIYKVEAYINKCVDSIIKQTYKDFELILVDDGSPDNCGQICDEYAKNDSRIKVIHKENGELSSARNAGIDIARGEYMFIDSDDYINEKMYEVLFNTAVFHSSDMAVCDFVKVGEGQLPSFKKNASLKYTLIGSLISLLKNSLLGWKQKVAITLFVINPFFFEKITKFEMKS